MTTNLSTAEQRIQDALESGAVELDLSGLGLTSVPDAIAQLTNLQRLDLSGNQLTSLPEALFNPTNPQVLGLSSNPLMSLLSNRKTAFIETQKLTGYLLSETHEIGQSKAKFLRSFGFNDSNVELLHQELLHIAHTQTIQETIETPHGSKYVLDGQIQAPNGRLIQLRTVWIIDFGQTAPAL